MPSVDSEKGLWGIEMSFILNTMIKYIKNTLNISTRYTIFKLYTMAFGKKIPQADEK